MRRPVDLALLKDFRDLFARRKSAHMGAHLYGDEGAALWQELAENKPTYYVSRADNLLLQASLPDLRKVIPANLEFRDNGPGAEESILKKTVPLVTSLRASGYTAIDVSPRFAAEACSAVQKSIPDIRTKPEVLNSFGAGQSVRDPAVVYFGGSTIGNIVHPYSKVFPIHKLADGLGDLAPLSGDYLIVSFDSNSDEQSLLAAYNASGYFCTNALRRLAAEVPHTGFDAGAFEYAPVWNRSGRQLAHFWRLVRDIEFSLGGESFSLKTGESFHGLNSYKPSEALVAEASSIAGLDVVGFFGGGDNPLRIAVLRRSSAMRAVAQDKVAAA